MTVLRWRHRFDITAEMELQSPLAIGAPEGTGTVDLPVVLDGNGRPFIPGTSLAGVLRSVVDPHLESLGPGASRRWFGGARDGDTASLVTVEDAVLDDPVIETRDHVGIDRVTGAAAPGIKYNRQVVAAGATTTVRLSVAAPKDREMVTHIAGVIAGVLASGVRVGAATSRGNGRLAPTAEPAVIDRSLDGFEATLVALRGGEPVGVDAVEVSTDRLDLELPWTPLTSLMVRAGIDGNAVDDLPLSTHIGADRVTLVVPGSSVKGALQSRAEWIVRTVLGLDSPERVGESSVADAFNVQMDVPLVGELFGRPAAVASEGSGPLPQGKAAVTVEDLRPLNPDSWPLTVTVGEWRSVAGSRRVDGGVRSPTADILDAIDRAGLGAALVPRSHVAIDRWTGAPSDSALFSTLEVNLRRWEPLRVGIDGGLLERRLPEKRDRRAALMLLMLVLRDVADGWVPLGFGVNRGHGSLEGEWAKMTVRGAGGAAAGGLRDPLGADRDALEDAWDDWVESFPAGHGAERGER